MRRGGWVAVAFGVMVAIGGTAWYLSPQEPTEVVVELAAQEVQVDGTLEIAVEDYVATSQIVYTVIEDTGRRVRMRPHAAWAALQTGARVRVRGRQAQPTEAVAPTEVTVVAEAPVIANTFGDQRTLVILVNFTDNPTQPYTVADAQAVTFTQSSTYYRDNTYQQTWLTGSVAGWFTIALASTLCDTTQIATLGDQAATAAGVNLSLYPRRIYGFPNNAGCTWWGLGTVGGNPSRAWINGTYSLKVVAHEFGHNLGSYHSKSLPCEGTPPVCTAVEYGDFYDMMGGSGTGHFTAFQKERLGWLAYQASPTIQTVAQSGAYAVEGLSAPGTGPKALKIPAATTGAFWYLEMRVPIGADAGLPAGVLVHGGTPASGSSSYLIDLDPVTTAFDAVLDVGQTFTAPGVAVSTMGTSATGATMTVTMAGPPPPPPPPPPPAVTLVSTSVSEATVYRLRATVSVSSGSAAGQIVTWKVTNPKGKVTTLSATTDSLGVASVVVKWKKPDPTGLYTVLASVTVSGVSATSASSFVR